MPFFLLQPSVQSTRLSNRFNSHRETIGLKDSGDLSMLLFWRIRYLDSRDRTFKDRDLWLETDTLDPATRVATELCAQLQDSGREREWLHYRNLFRQEKLTAEEVNERWRRHGGMASVLMHDYFEDENGQELSPKRMGEIVSGSPDAIMFPPGARQHDINYAISDKRPIPVDQITLSPDDLRILGYFVRDLREMLSSAFFEDGPGRLTSVDRANPVLETGVTDEEIRSFVMIFRRLYMKGDPAGFLKAVEVFAGVTQGYPLAQWIAGIGAQYNAKLERPPDLIPCVGGENLTFTHKRLIDVFLYTKYLHQPKPERTRQFQECLAAVGGREPLLTWLFLVTMWECSLHMRNAGVIIADFFDRYRQVHGDAGNVLVSVARVNPGIGRVEKRADRERRLVDEAVTRLAEQFWEEAGRPACGPSGFEEIASRSLRESRGPG